MTLEDWLKRHRRLETKNLVAKVNEYKPLPWIYIEDESRFEASGEVYASDQDPRTDAPILSADRDTCQLICALINREYGDR